MLHTSCDGHRSRTSPVSGGVVSQNQSKVRRARSSKNAGNGGERPSFAPGGAASTLPAPASRPARGNPAAAASHRRRRGSKAPVTLEREPDGELEGAGRADDAAVRM